MSKFLKDLPPSVAQFVKSQETISLPRQDPDFPYAGYFWKAVACILVSGRVKARTDDGLPNLTDTNRVCKQANFNQYLFQVVGKFLSQCDVVHREWDRYESGKAFADFWSLDLARIKAVAHAGLLKSVERETPYQRWRPPKRFEGGIAFLRAFFGAVEGLALQADRIGEAFLAFSRLPHKDLLAWLDRPGIKANGCPLSCWQNWLDAAGQTTLISSLYDSAWACVIDKNKREWFCLRDTGSIMLGLLEPPPPPPVMADLKVQADLSILAGLDLPISTLLPLFRHCRITRLDRTVAFRLDKKVMCEVPAPTTAAQDLLEALQPCAPLPDTVVRFLSDHPQKGGVLHLRPCRGWIRTDDPALIRTLRSHPKLKGYLDSQSPPGCLMIKENCDPNNFIQRCHEHGFEVRIQ